MPLLTKLLLAILVWVAMVGHASADVRKLTRRGKGKGMRGKGMMRRSRPTRMPTAPPQFKASLVTTSSAELAVVSCNETSVTIQGSHATNVTAASYLIYLEDGDIFCSDCSPLFRYVQSVQASSNGTLVLTARLATMGEIMGDIAGSATKNETAETLVGCAHSGAPVNRLLAKRAQQSPASSVPCDKEPCDPLPPPSSPQPQSFVQGACADNWLVKNPDGRCTYTNCYVGVDGDPTNCVECKRTCDNGCGPASFKLLNTDGNFGTFDFGAACCGHDYCWSTTRGKNPCNLDFYNEMQQQCPPLAAAVVSVVLPLVTGGPLPSAACHILAPLFFLGVNFPIISDIAYRDAQDKQLAHEKEDVCVAKCPSTQESGGQGTTVLNINLIVPSGTFTVSYDMYSIPDQLYIEYEGLRIFDTGGLVSGSGTAAVTYSGRSTKIKVTINAPNSGTAWDVFVGCPNGVSP